MASYNGTLADHNDLVGDKFLYGAITNEKSYEGDHSLKLYIGERREIWAGADAGAAMFSVKVWAPSGGTAVMIIEDPDTNESVGSDTHSGTGAWGDLEVAFTAEKKAYKVFLINTTTALQGDIKKERPVYFDNLEVE